MDRGNALFAEGQFSSALEAYQAAYKLYQSPKIAFNIARSAHKLGQLLLARRNYEVFIDSQKAEDSGAKPAIEASKLALKALDLELASVRVSGTPAGAKYTVGADYEGVVAGPRIYLIPGSYNLVVSEKGYSAYTQSLLAEKGRTIDVKVALEETKAEPKFYGKPWFWGAIGAVVLAGAATGIVAAASGGDPQTELGTSRWEDWDAL